MSRVEEDSEACPNGRPDHNRDAGVPEESMSERELIHDVPLDVAPESSQGPGNCPMTPVMGAGHDHGHFRLTASGHETTRRQLHPFGSKR